MLAILCSHAQLVAQQSPPKKQKDPLPLDWFNVNFTGMVALRALRLAGNAWSAPLDPRWGADYSVWAASGARPNPSLELLDLSDNPKAPGADADVPAEWLNLKLRELRVSFAFWLLL
jgi:hypothetical protein